MSVIAHADTRQGTSGALMLRTEMMRVRIGRPAASGEMHMSKFATIAALALSLCGCNSYYKVTELSTNDEYFYGPGSMPMRDTPGRGYPLAFKDRRSGKSVNIENYTIEKISKNDFNRAVRKSSSTSPSR